MQKKRRFVSTTDEEIEQKRLKMNAQKTIKQNIAAATLLHEYLKEKHLDTASKRAVTKQFRRKIREGQWAMLNFV
jgi:hypothetical protein